MTELILGTMRLKSYIKEFKETVDPYEVVECGLDSFDPYSYICMTKFKEKYPDLYKTKTDLNDSFSGDLDDFEYEWLVEIKG